METCGARRNAGNQPSQTTGSWLQSYKFMILGPGAIYKSWSRRRESEVDGVARLVARRRSSRSGYKVGSRRSSVAVLPKGGYPEKARVFPGGFPHLLYEFISYTTPTVLPTACGAASTAAAQPRIAAAGRGPVEQDLRVANGVVRVRVQATMRKRCVVLGFTLGKL